ncbi:aminopeptidase P N-terminal domain-containing protein [Myxococcota bacterium]|nr:aminopeptidase P N-terminal domain-containing protein [Myxococcota bacterium]
MIADLPSLPFAERRARVLAAMPERSAAVFPSLPVAPRNGDVEYPYRQHSDVLWLTGFKEPETVVLLRKGLDGPSFVMFVRRRDPEMEVWTGRRAGVDGARERFGAEAAHEVGDVRSHLGGYLREATALYVAFGRTGWFGPVLDEALEGLRRAKRQSWHGPMALLDPGPLLHELRLRKTPDEVAVMRRAADITAEAHRQAMEAVRPGMGEYEVQALVEYTFRRRGADGWGYPTIVGAGDNACILHYVENDDRIEEGELVLVDAGAEVSGYTADITRTFPAGRRFDPGQRDLYDAVLDVQKRLVDLARPGMDLTRLQDTAIRWLTERMVDLRLLRGDVDGLVESKAFRRFYPHGVSHFLGMDVHDVGASVLEGRPRPLEAGMVITVEPGLYVPPDAPKVPKRLRGIGVRIEDDVLLTAGDPEVLTTAAPKEVADVEALRRSGLKKYGRSPAA